MRKSIKIISSIFLSSMFMINGTLFAFATTDDINENLESKELCEASINEAFAADSIIVTMKNSCSLDFKNYDCADFPEVAVNSVENLSPYTYDVIKDKYEAIIARGVSATGGIQALKNYIENIDDSKSASSKFISYIKNMNLIKILGTRKNGLALFDASSQKRELVYSIDNFINKLDDEYDFLENYDYTDYHLTLKLSLDTNDKKSVLKAIDKIEQRDDVLSVSPNYQFEYDSVTKPNDEYLSNQWYLNRIGYFDALQYTKNTKTVRVGVMDSGVNADNPDLKDTVNRELSKSFVDDEPLTDSADHGTCVAGIIGACSNNSVGISGICNSVEIVSLKVGKEGGPLFSNISLALDYAEKNKIDLVNCSFGTLAFKDGNTKEPEECYGKYTGLIINSSGNESLDLDNQGFYCFPTSLKYDNIISVANSNENDKLNNSSNYGKISVDLAALGTNIYTTSSNDYRNFNGTSASCPMVTGSVALMKSIYPDISNSQLKAFLLNNVDSVDGLKDKLVSGGVLNIGKTLAAINSKKYIIKYDANGGNGVAMVNTSVCYGVNTKLNPNTYTKLDYRFVGWTAYRKSDNKWYYTDGKGNSKWCLENKQPNGYSKAVYKDCSKVAKTSSVNGDVVTMYAQWEKLQLGDVDMDGEVTIMDATLVQKYIAHLEDLTDQQKRLADVNGDGEITILDSTEIQKMLVNVKNKEA